MKTLIFGGLMLVVGAIGWNYLGNNIKQEANITQVTVQAEVDHQVGKAERDLEAFEKCLLGLAD